MNIRPASLGDKSAIMEMALEQAKRYEFLLPNRTKIDQLITNAISTAAHFCWVVEDKGKVAGVLVALTGDNLWSQRRFSAITLWVSKVVGGGVALLRRFRAWVLDRPAIVVAGMAPDLDLDYRVEVIMQRMGFQLHGGAYLLYS